MNIRKKQSVIRSFYSGPEWVNENSSINLLKKGIGIELNGIKTLKTEPISTKKETKYNGVSLKLEVDGDRVYLKIDNSFINPYWKLENILTMINIKNPKLNITKEKLIGMIKEGILEVRFNVLKKDHGTIWSYNERRDLIVKFRSIPHKKRWKELLVEDDLHDDDEETDFFHDF